MPRRWRPVVGADRFFWTPLARSRRALVALLVRELRAPRAAVIASFLVYPLALTAGWYLAGMSMLAGLAVAPLAPWFWLRSRFAAAGLVLAVVMLFKLNLALLAAAPMLALILLGAADADGLARSSAGGRSGGVVECSRQPLSSVSAAS